MKATRATYNTPPRKLAYSLEEVAQLTGLSLLYLRQRAGHELKVTRFGRMIRVLETDLEAFLKSGAPSYPQIKSDKDINAA